MSTQFYKWIAPLALTLAVALLITPLARLEAADHGDAPIAGNNQSADIADVFAFLDPNDNSRLVLILTARGFIAAGENANFGIFDQFLQYRFELETTGDAVLDQFINIQFTPPAQGGGPQTARISLPFRTFTAPSTRSSTAAVAPTQVVTTDAATGVRFFAGLVDDPFFFDIPGFGRFVASVRAGTPDPAAQLQRGRDSFAGYNDMGIALSIPLSFLGPLKSNTIGVNSVIRRQETTVVVPGFGIFGTGDFRQVDRTANPAVNVVLIPFARKDEHNFATPVDDANGLFANSIVSTLNALGTNATNIGVLANVAVVRGDYLRVNTTIANTGPRGGTNPGAGFPNGRRLADDTVDTLLFIITNGAITTGDNVNASDVAPNSTFPFLAQSQQPRAPGVIDDNTRN